jgi:hypothetical protein
MKFQKPCKPNQKIRIFRANSISSVLKFIIFSFYYLAGAEGIEPPPKVLETSILPLNYAPKKVISDR